MPTLYQIQQEYRDLVALVDEWEGELPPDLEARLVIDEAEFDQKAQAYRAIIREHQYEAEAFATEARRMQDHSRQLLGTVDRLKARLLAAVLERGGKAKAGLFTFWTVKTQAVEFTGDVASLPNWCVRTTKEPDKAAIKKALESPVLGIPERLADSGCRLVEHVHLGMR